MANQNLETVTLAPSPGIAPGGGWTVSHGGQSGSNPSNYPKVTLPKGTGPYLLSFEIQGSNQITFSNDPIWVQAGSKPTSKSLDGQIAAVVASKDGKQLFILDKNDNNQPVDLYYRLNFNGYGAVDPIINNGGSTTPPLDSASLAMTTLFITAATLAAVVYVAFQQSAIKQLVQQILTGVRSWTSKG